MNQILYLVIPCYNEEEVLHETAKRLFKKITNMIDNEIISKESKIVFVNDGSKDKTWNIIEELHNKQRASKRIVSRSYDCKRLCRYDHIP